MEGEKDNLVREVKSWLEVIFSEENLKNISVDIEGHSEKGDGYMGDIVFVHLTGKTENGFKKVCDLVLKCSKRSEILREKAPIKQVFLNEMCFYHTVLPVFTKFQVERGIEKPFSSTPRYVGMLQQENMEIIALANLKKEGYYLWNKKHPLTRKHIDLVMKEYGKFHAISVAMREQQPKEFKELSDSLVDVWKLFTKKDNMDALFGTAVQVAYEALTDDLSEDILLQWKNLRSKIDWIFEDLMENFTGLSVISHGDCWNNNFMFKNEDGIPSHVAFLDWQLSYPSSPVRDLSYFLFCCISAEDIEDLDTILKTYYESFSNYVKRLGSNLESLYPFSQFMSDWNTLCKFGIMLSPALMRICSLDRDDVPDIKETAEKGEEFSSTFAVEVKDKVFFKNRMKHIVKYSVEKGYLNFP